MSFGLPDKIDLAPLWGLIQTPSEQLWTAPNQKLSLTVTPQLSSCAKAAAAHFRRVEETYHEHFARLVEIAVGLLPEDAQAWAEDYFCQWANECLVPLGYLHLLAFTGSTPHDLLEKSPDGAVALLDEGWSTLLKAAGVNLGHPGLFAPQPQRIDHDALIRQYTIRGLLQDWDEYLEAQRQGWLKGKTVPVVAACADELDMRLQAHIRGSHRSGCVEPFDPTSSAARREIGDAVYHRLDPNDKSLPDQRRVLNLMSQNEPAQVFNNAVILLILRNS